MRQYTQIYLHGDELKPEQQAEAKRAFLHRYTGQHRPKWSFTPRPDGTTYPVQFKDDADWLANTVFRVTLRGKLHHECQSYPTWPNNPELRKS
jgi:hypothetical protein